jgi:uncharacterized protein DUF5655
MLLSSEELVGHTCSWCRRSIFATAGRRGTAGRRLPTQPHADEGRCRTNGDRRRERGTRRVWSLESGDKIAWWRWAHQLQSASMSVESHFAKKDPSVLATYRRVLDVARALGPVAEEAKKTSIHLVRETAFAGVATRRSSLILTLKSAIDIRSSRVTKREQTSANRWHLEVRLTAPAEVDQQLTSWLRAAYELGRPSSRAHCDGP